MFVFRCWKTTQNRRIVETKFWYLHPVLLSKTPQHTKWHVNIATRPHQHVWHMMPLMLVSEGVSEGGIGMLCLCLTLWH